MVLEKRGDIRMKLIITDLENFDIPIDGEYRIIKPDKEMKSCIGCFGCWIKTPGKCVIHDGYENTGILLGKCSELILISRCAYGSVSPFIKMVMDRAISYIHPDFVIRKGEMHHKRRYDNVIQLTAYFYGENITDIEKETARNLMEANADNYDGMVKSVQFYQSVKELEGVTL